LNYLLDYSFPLLISRKRLRIAADGAANRLRSILPNKKLDMIVGDLDSVNADTLEYYQSLGSSVIDQSDDQATTDLDKCLAVAAKSGCNQAIIVGELGSTRLDHLFGIVQSLFVALKPKGLFDDLTVFSSDSSMKLLLPAPDGSDCASSDLHRHIIEADAGSKCGLIPIGGACTDVTTEGLKWNLDHETLQFGDLISTSNTVTGPFVAVKSNGPLLWTNTPNET
jgi:thiamine pyrophosphokinase